MDRFYTLELKEVNVAFVSELEDSRLERCRSDRRAESMRVNYKEQPKKNKIFWTEMSAYKAQKNQSTAIAVDSEYRSPG